MKLEPGSPKFRSLIGQKFSTCSETLKRSISHAYCSFLQRALLPIIVMESPSSPTSELDLSPSRVPENGSEGSVSLEGWSDDEKNLDSGGSSPDHCSRIVFPCIPSQGQSVTTVAHGAKEQEGEGQLLWLSRCKSQPCQNQGVVVQGVRKPVAGTRDAFPFPGRQLRLQDRPKKAGTVEDGQEAGEKLDAQTAHLGNFVQLIDERGSYSSAKIVSATDAVRLLPCPKQRLEYRGAEGEDFEIREVIVDEKPFQCAICAKAFKRAWELFSHEVVHNEERPFCCQLCQVRA